METIHLISLVFLSIFGMGASALVLSLLVNLIKE